MIIIAGTHNVAITAANIADGDLFAQFLASMPFNNIVKMNKKNKYYKINISTNTCYSDCNYWINSKCIT